MSGNAGTISGRGLAKPDARTVMAAFDRLPADVRAVVRDARLDWAPAPILSACQRGMSAATIAAYIDTVEAEALGLR